jgi:hypothetical protein
MSPRQKALVSPYCLSQDRDVYHFASTLESCFQRHDQYPRTDLMTKKASAGWVPHKVSPKQLYNKHYSPSLGYPGTMWMTPKPHAILEESERQLLGDLG